MERPVLKAAPEQCPGAYDMHFYCKYENPDHGFQEFPWYSEHCETRAKAIAQVRRAGGIFHTDRTFTCPKCVKALGLKAGRAALDSGSAG